MTSDITIKYSQLFHQHLIDAAQGLEQHIIEVLDDAPHIDRVTARAKSPERFLAKAAKTEGDALKYDDPLTQIQDQIGARIIVFYKNDVPNIKRLIEKYFRKIEEKSKEPPTPDSFGYSGEHFILIIPDDIKPDSAPNFPKVFELQIKTLYEHAWSEASHDIGYKANRPLTSEEIRKMAFTAAQSWGADKIFTELAESLSPTADNDK